jgi:hypothetical protein
MTQAQMILNHLYLKGSITAWEAMRDYGIMRLAARIYDLHQDGHDSIAERRETVFNRFGAKVTYSVYYYSSPGWENADGQKSL